MGNVFDTMAGQPQQSNQPAAQTPSPAPAQAAAPGGNVFDQMATQQNQPVVSPVTGADQKQGEQPHESDTMDWLKKTWNSVGEHIGELVPQAATGPLAFATHYIIEPYNESMAWAGKTSGELAEEAMVLGTPYTVEQAREKFPRRMGVTGAVAETVGGTLADPRNWPLLAGKFARPILNHLMSGAFATQMGSGTKDQAVQLAENWDNMSPYERWHAGTQLGLTGAMTAAAATHAATGEAKATAPKSERGTVVEKRGTVAGERTTVRPTTRTTAGVEAPVPASAQENPNVFTKMAASAATPGEAAEFQKTRTKPAARRQMVSTLSQVATDKIAAHDAIVNGESTPSQITGTQTPGEHVTPDEIWPEMQRSAGQTWQKARDASAQEQAEWNQERMTAEREHQAALDEHNTRVSEYNADPSNKDNPLQPLQFNPDDVDHRERPQTYDELKAALDSAKDRTGFSNPTDVREKAKTIDVPKAEKALDAWFKDHADEVSPEEYDSAKRLWADSERFKEISNNLRPKLAKGTLTGNDIRGLEAVVDGKAITRRGAAGIGEFKRLLGPEATENLQNVAKLFDPFEKTSPLAQFRSWGMVALKTILAGGLGYEYAGPTGAAGAEGAAFVFQKLMNNVLFNPEFGSSFAKFVEATKNAVANGTQVSKDVLDTFKGHLKDLWSKTHGEMEIPGTGKMGNVGNEPKPKFDLRDNGVDENGDKNHILAISHEGEHIGHLNISQKTPYSWTINDSTVRPDMQGKGFGTAAYEHAFEQAAAKGMQTVESDISTSKSAAKTWERLKAGYPDAITEDQSQYTADLSKMELKPVFPTATEKKAEQADKAAKVEEKAKRK
jgi:predicted GNAT family acetyltransferase